MSLFTLDDQTDLSLEANPFHQGRIAEAIEKEHDNFKNSDQINKKTHAELEKELDDEEEKKAGKERISKANKLERSNNRKEALSELGDGLLEAAKASGRGVKETARLAYNLASGKKA